MSKRRTNITIEEAANQLHVSEDELRLMLDDLEAMEITLDKYEWLVAEIAKKKNSNLVVSDKNMLPLQEQQQLAHSVTEYNDVITLPPIDTLAVEAFLTRYRELEATLVAREHADAVFTEKQSYELQVQQDVKDASTDRANKMLSSMKQETIAIQHRLGDARHKRTTKTDAEFTAIVSHLPEVTQSLLKQCYAPKES